MNNTSISLYKGGFFNYEKPELSEYTIEDIARGLSHTARFSGQTDRPYYVSQHSIIVSKIVPPEHALAGLLHDAAESFMADIPSPLKQMLPGYKKLELRAEKDLCKRFGVKFPLHPCIKDADIKAFISERRDLQPGIPVDEKFKGIEPLGNKIIAWDSRTCYLNFLRRFDELTK